MKMKLTINPTFRPIADIIKAIPQTFDQSGETIYRGRNTVKILDSPAGNLIVKKFGHHNIFQRIYYTFIGTGKACRAYRFASEYNARGIKSPQGIAYIEINHGPLLGESYFISAQSHSIECFDYLVSRGRRDTRLIADIAALLVRMHESKIMHGDPNLKNILFDHTPDGRYELTVIDTNRSRILKEAPTYAQCVNNLKRVTHKRELLSMIAYEYAMMRHFDPGKFSDDVLDGLTRFERNRRIRHALKRFFRIKHHAPAKYDR